MEQWPVDLSPDALARWVEDHFEGTLMGLLKMQVIEVSKTRAVVELPVHAGLTTPSGHIHAGSMVSLADTSATFAAMAALQRSLTLEEMPVAVNISSQIVGNIKEGTLRSESTVVHPGRTLVVVTTRITTVGGKLLALVNSSHFNRQ
ncbi:MAG: PaaI family thioesterase [Dehalococcoidia bacterium]|nr:PaaI family thioesterase [Dehalococcoidia bacterium]